MKGEEGGSKGVLSEEASEGQVREGGWVTAARVVGRDYGFKERTLVEY